MTDMTNWSARCGGSHRDLAIRALSFNVKTPLFLVALEIAHREQSHDFFTWMILFS